MNERQLGRLKRLSDWLHENDRKFLFELLVPADRRAAGVGRRRHRPLRRRAAPRADAPRDRRDPGPGVEVDIWKIEGVDGARTPRCSSSRPARATAARASSAWCWAAAPATRRSTSGCAQAAPVEGFVGFAIGRSIWWDALKGFLDGEARARGRGDADRRQLPALHRASTRSRRRPSPEAAATSGLAVRVVDRRSRGAPSRSAPGPLAEDADLVAVGKRTATAGARQVASIRTRAISARAIHQSCARPPGSSRSNRPRPRARAPPRPRACAWRRDRRGRSATPRRRARSGRARRSRPAAAG